MKINEIKELKGFDVICNRIKNKTYEILYVLLNLKNLSLVSACQGYYDYKNNKLFLLDYTRKDITYDELLLYYDLIHKAGE